MYSASDIVMNEAKEVMHTSDLKYMATQDYSMGHTGKYDKPSGFWYWKEVKSVSECKQKFILGYSMGNLSYDYTYFDAEHAANRLNEILANYEELSAKYKRLARV